MGDDVWVKGVPTGMLLIHCSILCLMYEESPEYTLFNYQRARRIFESPRNVWIDPEQNWFKSSMGTSDLNWCSRIIEKKILQRSGWKEIGEREYPFLIDTDIFCKHIALDTGIQYPTGNTLLPSQGKK